MAAYDHGERLEFLLKSSESLHDQAQVRTAQEHTQQLRIQSEQFGIHTEQLRIDAEKYP